MIYADSAIADLAGSDGVGRVHVAEALSYRRPCRATDLDMDALVEPVCFARDGAERFRKVVEPEALRAVLAALPQDRPGVRISGIDGLRPFLAPQGSIGAVSARALGPDARAVRAILFDKTAAANWSIGWHQDRTICVRQRVDVEGFGPWTVKSGLQHVAPPFDLLTRMVTLRVHLDDVAADNAPLLIAPGSHRLGPIAEAEIDRIVQICGTRTCIAEAGDVWLTSTPIVHASKAVTTPTRRRVLQVDFAAESLPAGLEWLGV